MRKIHTLIAESEKTLETSSEYIDNSLDILEYLMKDLEDDNLIEVIENLEMIKKLL